MSRAVARSSRQQGWHRPFLKAGLATRFALALTIGSIVGSLLVVELALVAFGSPLPETAWQTFALHQPDSDLIYGMVPGTSHRWVTDEFEEVAQINRHGLRGSPIGEKERPRIIVLGDSMTFGQGVRDEETYASQLEGMFYSDGLSVQVINAGVKGYGTDQAYKLFTTRLRGSNPDIVVLALYANDLGDNINLSLFEIGHNRLVPLDATRHPLYRQGRMLALAPSFIANSHLGRLLIPRISGIGAFDPRTETPAAEPLQWVRRKFELVVAELVRMGAEDGFEVVLLGIPSRDDAPDQYLWLETADRSGVPFLDLNRIHEWREERGRFFFEKDPHLNVSGHREVAEVLHRFLTRTGAAFGS